MMLDYKRNGVAWQGATLGAAGPATCGVAAKPGVLGRQPLPGLMSPSRTRFVVVNRVYVDEKVRLGPYRTRTTLLALLPTLCSAPL